MQAALCDATKREDLFLACCDFVPDWITSRLVFNDLIDKLIQDELQSKESSSIDMYPVSHAHQEECVNSCQSERKDHPPPDSDGKEQIKRMQSKVSNIVQAEANNDPLSHSASQSSMSFEGTTLRSLLQELLGLNCSDTADPVVLEFLERAIADLLLEGSDCGDDLAELIEGCVPDSLDTAVPHIGSFLRAAAKIQVRLMC